MKVFLVEVGVLLDRDNEAFESYNQVYNKQYGFYDEEQFYETTFILAQEYAKNYVEKGCFYTYAIISTAEVDEEYYYDLYDIAVLGESYDMNNVLYNICKDDNGKIIENFLNK